MLAGRIRYQISEETRNHIQTKNFQHFNDFFLFTLLMAKQRELNQNLVVFRKVHVTFKKGRKKEGNVLFNDAFNPFYLQLYGVGHMVKDHSDSESGNLLLPHGLLFPINSKGSFICIIRQTG